MTTETKTETPKRHPLAVAWDEWLASKEGDECRAANTLPHNTSHYLENRLYRAFMAGAKTGAAKVADRYIADMRSVRQRTEYGEGCLNAAVYIAKAIREGR